MGHAPFGHQGEKILKKLSQRYLKNDFWHEQNGLRFVDKIELLEDNNKIKRNLNLTYAVRDGIISHCGEINQNGIKPRNISLSIDNFDSAGKYQAVTWEGCVVKIADKIAYVGRDIEDADNLGLLSQTDKSNLSKIAREFYEPTMNTTVIMHNLIIDICKNSSPEKGICLSDQCNEMLNMIKDFNYKTIYSHKRLIPFENYSELVLKQIFETLVSYYDKEHTWNRIDSEKKYTPKLSDSFQKWLARYCFSDIVPEGYLKEISLSCENIKIYKALETKKLYIQAIIDYISGMTDRFAIELFNEQLDYC